MATASGNKPAVLFVHGLWLHGQSWNPWIEFFKANGYEARALSWPGDGPTPQATRQNANAVANHGVAEVANHLASQFGDNTKPILIGHSFGGLLVQNLLARNLASAAIAIDPAGIQGVLALPLSTLKAGFPVLGNPLNLTRSVSLTEAQFRFAFANAVPETEARTLYEKYAIPAPGRPVFQAAIANFNPFAETKVDTANPSRGPLLLIAGESDNTVPPVIVRSTQRLYRKSPAITELKEFAKRGHSLTIDSGWKELADYSLGWLRGKGL